MQRRAGHRFQPLVQAARLGDVAVAPAGDDLAALNQELAWLPRGGSLDT
jgi:hypothetical protein